MRSGQVNIIIRALRAALADTTELHGQPKQIFECESRSLVVQAILSILESPYDTSGIQQKFQMIAAKYSPHVSHLTKSFSESFFEAPGISSTSVNLAEAAALIDGLSIETQRSQWVRIQGSVFTPPDLANFLAWTTTGLDTSWSTLQSRRVIDPACGAGSLLLATLEDGKRRIAAKSTIGPIREWVMANVVGIERDYLSAAAAASLLGLALEIDPEEIMDRGVIIVGDSLIDSRGPGICGFDQLIMNPPWVKTKELRQPAYIERLKSSPLFPLTVQRGRGDFDLYQFFLERAFSLTANLGRIGFIVPGSFLRGTRAERLRHLYLTGGHWVRLDEFWNQDKLFPIHGMFRFVTGVFQKGATSRPIEARFRLRSVAEARTKPAQFLEPSIFIQAREKKANPIPELPTPAGFKLFSKLGANHPSFGSVDNPWSRHCRFRRELDMTLDRHLFHAGFDVDDDQVARGGMRPVYEGRMVNQFDAMAKTYVGGRARRANWQIWQPGRPFRSQFYVAERDIPTGIFAHTNLPRAGFCDVTGHANERTVLAAMIPGRTVCGNKVPTLEAEDNRLHLIWVAIANSFVIDWLIRRSVTTSLNLHYFMRTPFPWVWPGTAVGRGLSDWSNLLASKKTSDSNHLWDRAFMRAKIDCLVASLFGLGTRDLYEVFEDFPLIDRGQPSTNNDPSTVTRDLVISKYSQRLGRTDESAKARLKSARSCGAIPYIPGQVAVALSASGN